MSKTTSEFLEGLKRRITMPANQVLLQDTDILDMGSDTLKLKLTKLLKASRQNYLLTTSDVPLVADQAYYDIPYRAVINGLEDIKWVLSDSQTLRPLAYIVVEDLNQYPQSASNPQAFYFQSDQVGLAPVPASASGSLRYWWHRQLSKLCTVGAAGQVTGIVGSVVTVDNAPATFVSGAEIDFIKNQSLGTILEQDVSITNVAGTQLTFASGDVPGRLAVGDWVSIKKTTPIIPIPDECYDYFEALVGVDCLKAIGDNEGASELQKDVEDLEKDVKSLLEPRIDGEPEKIVNYHSLLRQKSWRAFGGGYW